MKYPSITFVTGNQKKVEWMQKFLTVPLEHAKVDLPELQSLDIREVVTHKAQEAYRQLQRPIIVEDTALVFLAFGQLPGPLVKWFLTQIGNEGMCRMLHGETDRRGVAQVCYAIYDGEHMELFYNERTGIIPEEPRGDLGFGWDPIFIPDGQPKTWGEMTEAEQRATLLRRPPLEKIQAYLSA